LAPAQHGGRSTRGGTVYEITVNLWATANVFLPGHRIRLEVASSNFPASMGRRTTLAHSELPPGTVGYDAGTGCFAAMHSAAA
jgi:predicted acyl esterase